jgi:PAS domain S-box-containing protein
MLDSSTLVQALPMPTLVVDLDGVARQWNHAAAHLLDWPEPDAPEVRAPHLFRNVPLWFRRLADKAAAGQADAHVRLRRRTHDGRTRHLRVSACALKDDRGRTWGLLLSLERGGRLQRLRDDLRESERRYQSLVEYSPDAIFIHDEDRILFVNPAACRLVGAERPADLMGRAILDFVHADCRDAFTHQTATAAGRAASTQEHRLLRLDGQVIDADVVAAKIAWRHSLVTQLIIHDVTPQKRAEAGLRAIQQRFRLLAEGVRDSAIVMLDGKGATVSWNAGIERLTGYRADQAIHQDFAFLFTEDERADGLPRRLLERAMQHGRTEDERWCARRDASRFWANYSVTALYDPAGLLVGFACIIRDLTERREAEAALRRSEDHLRQAQKMEGIGRLAGGIAHDFNNLLTAIQGHSQFLLEDLSAGDPSRLDAEEIKKAADRAATLTRQLLAFSRRQVLQPQVIDLNAIIRDMQRLLRRVIREDIALNTHLAENAWSIFADPGHIEQVLMNLVVNARDAMPNGGTLTIETRNFDVDEEFGMGGTVIRAGRYLQLSVSDTGIGMNRETRARIFEPFFTTKPEGEGTGLGLATVYGIVRHSGGHVSVYSEPGRGTTFRVLLPEAGTDTHAEPSHPAPSEMARGWESILVVEDDPAIRSLTSKVLQDRGYSVLEAESGTEAVRLAQEYDGPIDLLVTDIVMPEMSGRKLAENVRALHPAAKVLFMSGFTAQDVVRQGLIEPEAHFLEKPFSPETLAGTIRRTLDQ